MWAVHALQGVLIVAVLALIGERVRVLLYEAPVGAAFLRALERSCRAARPARALSLARQLPRSWAARVVEAGLSPDRGGLPDVEEELLDIRALAVVRLRALRICATLASTLGLLGAIVALVRGFGGGEGLLALEAGLVERMAVGQALLTMGIGVATSAVCFYAFAQLRRAALSGVSQATRAARALEPLVT